MPGHDADVPIASTVALAARGSRPGKSLAGTLASHGRDDGDQPDSRPCTATVSGTCLTQTTLFMGVALPFLSSRPTRSGW